MDQNEKQKSTPQRKSTPVRLLRLSPDKRRISIRTMATVYLHHLQGLTSLVNCLNNIAKGIKSVV